MGDFMDGFMGNLIGLVAVLSIFALPVGGGIFLIYKRIKTKYDERMEYIKQGIIPPDAAKRKTTPNRYVSLRNGIVLVSLGIGLIVGFLCTEYLVIGENNVFWMMAASIVFFMGAGFLTYFFITRKMMMPEEGENDFVQE
jgi:uncharacterized protein YneF (UPF0154 family)